MAGASERQPSAADRPPVSRVGEKLAEVADSDPNRDEGEAERDAVERARHEGWDHDLTDVGKPPGDIVATDDDGVRIGHDEAQTVSDEARTVSGEDA